MHRIAFSIAAVLSVFIASPSTAQTVITQAKALAGNVTPGDTPGYPISLWQPGAYVLGSNLSVPSGTNGIYAGVDNIDVDLNGFTISGGGVANYAFASSKGQGQIHGGVIKSFRNSGILLRGDAWTIEDMKIVQNGGSGVDATGSSLITLQNSLVAVNNQWGIVTGNIGFFRNNKVVNNKYTGIACEVVCHIEGNIVDLNAFYGVFVKSGVVIGNAITRNTLYGLYDSDGFADTNYANNLFTGNNPNDTTQVFGSVAVHPNQCLGTPPCPSP